MASAGYEHRQPLTSSPGVLTLAERAPHYPDEPPTPSGTFVSVARPSMTPHRGPNTAPVVTSQTSQHSSSPHPLSFLQGIFSRNRDRPSKLRLDSRHSNSFESKPIVTGRTSNAARDAPRSSTSLFRPKSSPILRQDEPPPMTGLSLESVSPEMLATRYGIPLCGAILDDAYLLIGTTAGLDFIPLNRLTRDKSGKPQTRRPISLVKRTKFKQIEILSERSNVLLAISGRNDHVRVYGLDGIRAHIEKRSREIEEKEARFSFINRKHKPTRPPSQDPGTTNPSKAGMPSTPGANRKSTYRKERPMSIATSSPAQMHDGHDYNTPESPHPRARSAVIDRPAPPLESNDNNSGNSSRPVSSSEEDWNIVDSEGNTVPYTVSRPTQRPRQLLEPRDETMLSRPQTSNLDADNGQNGLLSLLDILQEGKTYKNQSTTAHLNRGKGKGDARRKSEVRLVSGNHHHNQRFPDQYPTATTSTAMDDPNNVQTEDSRLASARKLSSHSNHELIDARSRRSLNLRRESEEDEEDALSSRSSRCNSVTSLGGNDLRLEPRPARAQGTSEGLAQFFRDNSSPPGTPFRPHTMVPRDARAADDFGDGIADFLRTSPPQTPSTHTHPNRTGWNDHENARAEKILSPGEESIELLKGSPSPTSPTPKRLSRNEQSRPSTAPPDQLPIGTAGPSSIPHRYNPRSPVRERTNEHESSSQIGQPRPARTREQMLKEREDNLALAQFLDEESKSLPPTPSPRSGTRTVTEETRPRRQSWNYQTSSYFAANERHTSSSADHPRGRSTLGAGNPWSSSGIVTTNNGAHTTANTRIPGRFRETSQNTDSTPTGQRRRWSTALNALRPSTANGNNQNGRGTSSNGPANQSLLPTNGNGFGAEASYAGEGTSPRDSHQSQREITPVAPVSQESRKASAGTRNIPQFVDDAPIADASKTYGAFAPVNDNFTGHMALEYVKLARTKGARMFRAFETQKRTYLAVLCGETGERVEVFTGSKNVSLSLNRTFVLPQSPRTIEFHMLGDDLIDLFLVYPNSIFALEPNTVRVREVGIGRNERRQARRERERQARDNAALARARAEANDAEDAANNGWINQPRDTVQVTTPTTATVPELAAPHNTPTSTNANGTLNPMVTQVNQGPVKDRPYCMFQQLKRVPTVPSSALASSLVIPPTYESVVQSNPSNHPSIQEEGMETANVNSSLPLLSPISLLLGEEINPPGLFFVSRGRHSTLIVDSEGRSVLRQPILWSGSYSKDDSSEELPFDLDEYHRVEALSVNDGEKLAVLALGPADVQLAYVDGSSEKGQSKPGYIFPTGMRSRRERGQDVNDSARDVTYLARWKERVFWSERVGTSIRICSVGSDNDSLSQ